MHKGYLTTLSQEFMQGMVGFDLKYLETYHIACSAVTLSSVLLCVFWDTLNPALENSSKDIVTKQFPKLLALLYIIFFQDFIFLRQKYLRHPLFDHFLFFLPEYGVFAKKVLANSVDKNTDQNTLIHTTLPHLGQQVVNFHVRLAGILKARFQKEEDNFNLMEGKLDNFLTSKVMFTLTLSKNH